MAEEISHMWTLLRVARTDLYLGQVEDFGEDADVVGVWDEGVKSLTAGHGGGDGLHLVTAHIQFLQQLQLAQLTDNINTVREKQTWGQERMQTAKPRRGTMRSRTEEGRGVGESGKESKKKKKQFSI